MQLSESLFVINPKWVCAKEQVTTLYSSVHTVSWLPEHRILPLGISKYGNCHIWL